MDLVFIYFFSVGHSSYGSTEYIVSRKRILSLAVEGITSVLAMPRWNLVLTFLFLLFF